MSVTILVLFCLVNFFHQSYSSSGLQANRSPGRCSDFELVLLGPEDLFRRESRAPVGDSDQGKESILLGILGMNKGDRELLVGKLLSGLNEMHEPYVSDPVIRLFSEILDDECGRLLSDMDTGSIQSIEDKSTNVRFMYDMKLLRNAPAMRCCLLSSFYRAVARVRDPTLQQRLLTRHLLTAKIEADSGEEVHFVRTALYCLIMEAPNSPKILYPFREALDVVQFTVFKGLSDELTVLIGSSYHLYIYYGLISACLELVPPHASDVVCIQAGIDWKKVFRGLGILPAVFDFVPIHDYVKISLPIDSDDPELKEMFEKVNVDNAVQVVVSLLYNNMWHTEEGILIDIRPGIKRYINFLWRRGKQPYAQTFAMAVCGLYDMDSWEGEAGWKTKKWSSIGSGGLTVSEQVTVFHRLPREIFPRIGPVMPVLVSKATYQLVELRASFSNMAYFVPQILKRFTWNAAGKLMNLHCGWSAGLSASEIGRMRWILASHDAGWMSRLPRLTNYQGIGKVTGNRQGRMEKNGMDYSVDPANRIGLLVLSLVFGTAPFEITSSDERLDFLLVLRSQYPKFVSVVQTIEALTRSERDKLARVHALVSVQIDKLPAIFCQFLDWNLFHEWLFTKYLSDAEFFELIRTCDVTSRFWKAVIGVCRTGTLVCGPVPLGALKRCANAVKKGLVKGDIERPKVREMLLALGVPESFVADMQGGRRQVLFMLLPSLISEAGGQGIVSEDDSSLGQLPSSPKSWAQSISGHFLQAVWFIVMNFSDNDIVGILQNREHALDQESISALTLCLSAPAKSRILAEAAREPLGIDDRVIMGILKTQEYTYDGWEPECVVFRKEFFKSERYRSSAGCIGGICGVFNTHSRYGTEESMWFYHLLTANLRPELLEIGRTICEQGPENNAVLSMLLNGRTVRSIGKSLYLLTNGNVDKINGFLLESLARPEYIERINTAVNEFAKGPGKVIGTDGLAQQRRFVETFNLSAAEKDRSLCSKAFGDVLKSLATPADFSLLRTFNLVIQYDDGTVSNSIAVPQDLPPVYLFRAIQGAIREPFEIELPADDLHVASTIGDLNLPDTITVRVLSQPEEIAKQLKVIFGLIIQGYKQ